MAGIDSFPKSRISPVKGEFQCGEESVNDLSGTEVAEGMEVEQEAMSPFIYIM